MVLQLIPGDFSLPLRAPSGFAGVVLHVARIVFELVRLHRVVRTHIPLLRFTDVAAIVQLGQPVCDGMVSDASTIRCIALWIRLTSAFFLFIFHA